MKQTDTEIIYTMLDLHVAKGILLDNLALPLKEPARASHGLTILLQEFPVGTLTDLMTALFCFSTTDTHTVVFFMPPVPFGKKTPNQNMFKKDPQ